CARGINNWNDWSYGLDSW
nr:immunoglobulin heavy chain junction region [Macaca mulatta]